jgi:formylglycine-generating enzyme required for sulfatase activity
MGFNPSDPRYIGDSLPVQRVNWNDAQEFCRRLAARTHHPYRLPTEAEWEYACRANQLAPFGEGRTLNDVGWWAGNSGHVLHAVATKSPNFWGLYDMHGGVFEWCLDPYQVDPPSNTSIQGPPAPNADRVIRGGSFLSDQIDCGAAARFKASPQTRKCDLGFRIAFDDPAMHFPAQ